MAGDHSIVTLAISLLELHRYLRLKMTYHHDQVTEESRCLERVDGDAVIWQMGQRKWSQWQRGFLSWEMMSFTRYLGAALYSVHVHEWQSS